MKMGTMPPAPDPVFTLHDLETWNRPGVSLAVVGHPIKHSISPLMHNATLAELAGTEPRFADWKYFRFEIPPEYLPRALELLRTKKFRGVNLTVPHKIIAFEYLARRMSAGGKIGDPLSTGDRVDRDAVPIGAVNTLRLTEGRWEGFNTDGYGLAADVRGALNRKLEGSDVILLGAGGAARGAAVECLQPLRPCSSLWIANRSRANLEALYTDLRAFAGNAAALHIFDPAKPPHDLPESAIVINATSLGLKETDGAPVDLAALPRPAAVYDMIYNPPRTALLRAATTLGIPSANGLGMLVHQGAKSLEIWSGLPAEKTAPAMLAAARTVFPVH